MGLFAYNKTTSTRRLPVVGMYIPATTVAGTRGFGIDVTNELKGLSGAQYTAVQADVTAKNIELQWSTPNADYATTGLQTTLSDDVGPVADPGNAGAIPVSESGTCNLVSAGAETRTLAAPQFVGQQIALNGDTVVGAIAVTVASAFNTAGNTIITVTAAGQNAVLVGATIAGALRWRLIANDGTTLS
jgi:hypothetical protein